MIFQRRHPRNHLMTPTQWGKSHTVALAVLTRVAVCPEKWGIIAGRAKQAQIIMGYIIQHAFDNDYTRSKLEIPKGESLEWIRRERSKNRLTFMHEDGTMGEVFVLSADSRNKQTKGESIMGFGARNVILDEAALIDDETEAKIFRMLGAKTDNFYLKIGNPFKRNHFLRDYNNPLYNHMVIDWEQAVAEGRFTREFVEEARTRPLFDILYEVKFPPADMIDDKGYVPLVSEGDLNKIDPQPFVGRLKLGVDPAGEGRDETVWVVRDGFKARVAAKEKISTPQSIAGKTLTLMADLNIAQEDVYVDSFGEGAKTVHELAKERVYVNLANVGDACEDPELKGLYINVRAFAYYSLREWLKKGGMLIKGGEWDELLDIKYRAVTGRRIQIIPKVDLLKDGIPSPNTADALMVTFAEERPLVLQYKPKPGERHEEEFDRHAAI